MSEGASRTVEIVNKRGLHARAGIDPATGGQDVLAALFHVVFRADADGGDRGLRAHHMLHGEDEFLRQAPVRDDHEADHLNSLNGNPHPAAA